MTLDNVDLVRNAYEAYGRGDTSVLDELVDADLEWTFLDPSEEDPEPQVCHGGEQLIYWMQRRSSQGQRATLEEVSGHGERVLVATRTSTVDGTPSPTPSELRYHVVTIKEGRIVALRACRNQAEALAVAGDDGRPTAQ